MTKAKKKKYPTICPKCLNKNARIIGRLFKAKSMYLWCDFCNFQSKNFKNHEELIQYVQEENQKKLIEFLSQLKMNDIDKTNYCIINQINKMRIRDEMGRIGITTAFLDSVIKKDLNYRCDTKGIIYGNRTMSEMTKEKVKEILCLSEDEIMETKVVQINI